ncbi:MAG: hypothetical protein ACYSTF_01075 [Planctomycetota bacterium]
MLRTSNILRDSIARQLMAVLARTAQTIQEDMAAVGLAMTFGLVAFPMPAGD